MPPPDVTVVIPTLAADSALVDCIRSLEAQSYKNFEVIVIDNSTRNKVRELTAGAVPVRVIENVINTGFGAAINQGYRASAGRYVVALNDDVEACPAWLGALVQAAGLDPEVGMVASQVRLGSGQRLDSAGMLIAADGSSKQRGHGQAAERFGAAEEVLLPSGAAALYRRELLDEVGGFDESFFLYCEDTDLGLRARWGGWRCLYEPRATVMHRYSHSAGRGSALKAYYVERNRLAVLVKHFPARVIWRAPFSSLVRYWWHLAYMLKGQGAASEFRREGGSGFRLAWYVLRAHLSLLVRLPALLRERRRIRREARIRVEDFVSLLRQHAISAKEVAAL